MTYAITVSPACCIQGRTLASGSSTLELNLSTDQTSQSRGASNHLAFPETRYLDDILRIARCRYFVFADIILVVQYTYYGTIQRRRLRAHRNQQFRLRHLEVLPCHFELSDSM